MKSFIALGAIVAGGAVATRFLSPVRRRHLSARVSRRMLQRMEHFMASLPDNAPPKLIASVLPRLRDQNDQIVAMLREQNQLPPRAPAGSNRSLAIDCPPVRSSLQAFCRTTETSARGGLHPEGQGHPAAPQDSGLKFVVHVDDDCPMAR